MLIQHNRDTRSQGGSCYTNAGTNVEEMTTTTATAIATAAPARATATAAATPSKTDQHLQCAGGESKTRPTPCLYLRSAPFPFRVELSWARVCYEKYSILRHVMTRMNEIPESHDERVGLRDGRFLDSFDERGLGFDLMSVFRRPCTRLTRKAVSTELYFCVLSGRRFVRNGNFDCYLQHNLHSVSGCERLRHSICRFGG